MPGNQINILERKINVLSSLLLEWKSYETILNLNYAELKELVQLKDEPLSTGNNVQEDQEDKIHQTKSDSIPHPIHAEKAAQNISSMENSFDSGNEQGANDITSLFSSEQAEQFEIEFEALRNKTASLFGEHPINVEKKTKVEVSPEFIDSLIPDISINPGKFESLDEIEDVFEKNEGDANVGEDKLITEILQEKLSKLESEKLSTKQKNKLNQIKRIVQKISEIKIYNPKLLEKLIQSVN